MNESQHARCCFYGTIQHTSCDQCQCSTNDGQKYISKEDLIEQAISFLPTKDYPVGSVLREKQIKKYIVLFSTLLEMERTKDLHQGTLDGVVLSIVSTR